jgi:DNA-binding response OmpR family regulator
LRTITSQHAPRRVLIVDDDPNVVGTLAEILTGSGYEVFTAGDGAIARAKIQELRPELVILDVMLPAADGLVLCAELKRRGTAVIVCSGTSRRRDGILALRLGADDFISKPFDLDDFEMRVAAVLNAARRPRLQLGRDQPRALPGRRPGDRPGATRKVGRLGVALDSDGASVGTCACEPPRSSSLPAGARPGRMGLRGPEPRPDH